MIIRFGYVAISKILEITSSHTITYTNYEKLYKGNPTLAYKKLEEISIKNLNNLIELLNFNIKNNIHFFRITSSIFPLFSHPKINYNYLSKFQEKLKQIGKIVNENNLRVDIHLDQFCVLSSTNKEVVKSTINIIKFYKNMFNIMNIKSHMILHIGSSVCGKQRSITRFINNFNKLDEESKKLIVVENDDKIYNIDDLLYLSDKLEIPIVLDYHHHICNNTNKNIEDYIEKIFKTWKNETPKIHFSSPKNKKEFRSHNDYINVNDFIEFLNKIKNQNQDFDIMIEAKEKDFAMLKLIHQLKYKNYIFIDETTLKM